MSFVSSEQNAALRARLERLLQVIDQAAQEERPRIDAALPVHRESAQNLAHYLRLRKEDLRALQLELASIGLSSLAGCEGHVRDVLVRLLSWLAEGDASPVVLDQERAKALLRNNTQRLFGSRPASRHVYIMVTAPDAAVVTPSWCDELLRAGVDVLRINGAHESPSEWHAITTRFKARAQALDRRVRVFVDLPGPKLRTEVRDTEGGVLHLRRHKDRRGRTLEPTVVRLVERYSGGAELPLPSAWLRELADGDRLDFVDAGKRQRALRVRRTGDELKASCDRSLYLESGLEVSWERDGQVLGQARSGELPPQLADLRLSPGDAFLLRSDTQKTEGDEPVLVLPEPELLREIEPGERVILDDGKVLAIAEEWRSDGLLCRVKQALKPPTRVRSGKGVAFPDSDFRVSALSPEDETALSFALEAADGVEVSFVNSAYDVRSVGERVKNSGRSEFGLILKLETLGAMRHLPEILFEALQYEPVGLMIARGDLAVELSFERLAEMQEELLWFGEACHLPVVWATQVLETAAHGGVPTRAEVTDAAMSMRAECVMLNKGPQIADAVRMLADIICKMEAHQYKKRSLYRGLSIAGQPR